MPAYRSEAEGEIRTEVVKRLRQLIPGCRIIHEINVESFGNRIDVLAVGERELMAVEIKSKKDKLDRLPNQVRAMNSVSNHVFIALHEKFLEGRPDGIFFPPKAGLGRAISWIYPIKYRPGHVEVGEEWRAASWRPKKRLCLPHDALTMLWRGELQNACRAAKIKGAGSMNMHDAADALRWRFTGEQITRLICATLRARECVEADEPIMEGLKTWMDL